MPTPQHLQYNSPMPLYSSGNVQQAYNQQVGQMGPGGKQFNIEDSATYRLIHESERSRSPSSRRSGMMEEVPKHEDHPHYRGFVDPAAQSPSFTRLQNVTTGPVLDDYYPHEHRPARSRSEDEYRFLGVDRQDRNPSPTFHRIQRQTGTAEDYGHMVQANYHEPERDHPLEPGFQQKISEAEKPNVPPTQTPAWARKAEEKKESWRKLTVEPEPEQRGHFPTGSEVQADWRGADLRHQRDIQHQDYQPRHFPTGSEVHPDWAPPHVQEQSLEFEPIHYPTGAEVAPGWAPTHQTTPMEFSSKHYPTGAEVKPEWQSAQQRKEDKWKAHYSHFNLESGRSGEELTTGHSADHFRYPKYQQQQQQQQQQQEFVQQRPRAKSQEPPWRSQRQSPRSPSVDQGRSRYWLKPYVAPNIEYMHGSREGPAPILTAHRLPGDEQHRHDLTSFGTYYGPSEGFKHGRRHEVGTSSSNLSWHGMSGYRAHVDPHHRRPDSGFHTLPASHRQTTTTTMTRMSGEHGGSRMPEVSRPPVRETPPSWAGQMSPSWAPNDQKTEHWQTRTERRSGADVGHPVARENPAGWAPEQKSPSWAQSDQKTEHWQTRTERRSGADVSHPVARENPAGWAPGQKSPSWAQSDQKTEHSQTRTERHGTDVSRQVQPMTTSRMQPMTQSFQHESDAWKQRRLMEEDLRHRQEQHKHSKDTKSVTSTTGTSGSGPLVKTYTTVTTGDAARPQWQQALGASTKATTSGDFLDPEGHKVSYTKEVYTSSDPGKEFSMLTQEEKKIMEEPVEPGVISRHVTTKYYKKSTYTSSSTTSTSQTPPAVASATPRSIAWHQGQLSPGVSQF